MNKENLSANKNTWSLILLALVVFLSRLPFLFNGYGAEEDSWGLVVNTHEMLNAGHYIYSRLPGHPVQELILLLIPGSGPFFHNLLSAIFATLAAVFFARILSHYKFIYPLLGGLALSFIPVFYISSVSTIDYCWALAFIIMSYYFLLKNHLYLAGIMLGIAVGCRITSVLMFIPFLMMIPGLKRPIHWKSIIIFTSSFVLAGIIVYLPALIEYGFSVISTYKLPYPPLAKAIYKSSFGVWGITGLLALVYGLIVILKNRKIKTNPIFSKTPARIHVYGWIMAVIINVLIFINLPEKSAFFTPALPFIIILIGYWMKSSKAFIIVCVLFILSPFFLNINLTDPYRGSDYSSLAKRITISGQEIYFDPLDGPIFSDYTKRIHKNEFTTRVIDSLYELKNPSLIITGWWYNEIKVGLLEKTFPAKMQLLECADQLQLQSAMDKGFDIYYLPEIDRINDNRYGKIFTAQFAKKFPL